MTRLPTSQSPTQRERVLAALLEADEVCGSELYRQFIPRFSVHIHKLRSEGYVITKRPCDRPGHDHTGPAWLYKLEALPVQPSGKACSLCGGRLGHVSDCPTRLDRFAAGQRSLFGGTR